MKQLLIQFSMMVVIAAILHSTTSAQVLVADTLSPAATNAIAFYNNTLGEQLHLYNGKEYKDYSQQFEDGDPYFLTTTSSKGTVSYDGNLYNDVAIWYNVVDDDVVILDHSKILKIRLIKDKVQAFSLAGHSFINLTRDSLRASDMSVGFYQVLTAGKVSLLAKRTKTIKSFTKQKVEYNVYGSTRFYLKKNNSYISINSKRALLDHLADKKKELEQFINQNKLKFNNNRSDHAMSKIVVYYNQLTNL